MTVAELIEELRKVPQHHPILVDVGLRYNESVGSIFSHTTLDSKAGPSVVISTISDNRNDPEREEWEA